MMHYKKFFCDIPGHGMSGHDPNSTGSPIQGSPNPSGGGLSHFLSLVFSPKPHVSEHIDQLVHVPHSPFTFTENTDNFHFSHQNVVHHNI